MSEYQLVAFRAVDRALTEEQLQYMHKQSSRAEITPWSFENEYHHSDFNGNTVETLRRGYDVHFYYASFGTRKVMFRLPAGFPDLQAPKPYLVNDAIKYIKDVKGSGGILSIELNFDPGTFDELWEAGGYTDLLVPLRAELLEGDLRPLYLAHLAVSLFDFQSDPENTKEAPVPAGLDSLSPAQKVFAEVFGLDDSLTAAAAQESSPLPESRDVTTRYGEWIEAQTESEKNEWLTRILLDPAAPI